jgi:hypothetical protein
MRAWLLETATGIVFPVSFFFVIPLVEGSGDVQLRDLVGNWLVKMTGEMTAEIVYSPSPSISSCRHHTSRRLIDVWFGSTVPSRALLVMRILSWLGSFVSTQLIPRDLDPFVLSIRRHAQHRKRSQIDGRPSQHRIPPPSLTESRAKLPVADDSCIRRFVIKRPLASGS